MNFKEFDKKMTVFYSKSTGRIKALCKGEQDFSFFGEDGTDMEIILNKLITDYNQNVIMNMGFYLVENNKIKVDDSSLNKLRL